MDRSIRNFMSKSCDDCLSKINYFKIIYAKDCWFIVNTYFVYSRIGCQARGIRSCCCINFDCGTIRNCCVNDWLILLATFRSNRTVDARVVCCVPLDDCLLVPVLSVAVIGITGIDGLESTMLLFEAPLLIEIWFTVVVWVDTDGVEADPDELDWVVP